MQIFSKTSLQYALNDNIAHAFWLVGRAFAFGVGERRDLQQARELFERGVILGSPLCKRDLALLTLANECNNKERSAKERSRQMDALSAVTSTGAANIHTLSQLVYQGTREQRAQAIRWLQHELIFSSNWQAGFTLYLALLFPDGHIPSDNAFLHSALLELAEEKAQARKALAFGLLSGALLGRAHYKQAIRLLQRGTTPNEVALAALVSLEYAGAKCPKRFLQAERSLFMAVQAGSSIGSALLLRLTLQQMENSADNLSRVHICKSLCEHLANYPMHADNESLRILIRWFAEDRTLRTTYEPRLRKILIRSADLGMNSAQVALARIALIEGDPSGSVDRLRQAACRGHTFAAQLLALPEMRESGALRATEGRFWEHLHSTEEMLSARRLFNNFGRQTQTEVAHALS